MMQSSQQQRHSHVLIDELYRNPNLRPEIVEQTIPGLATSKSILSTFLKKLKFQEENSWNHDFLSANGDFKTDIACGNLETWTAGEDRGTLSACKLIYGVTNLAASVIVPPPVANADKFPTLLNDENMLAILNARGTVMLNTLFYKSEAQLAVFKLSETALQIWREWAVTHPHPDQVCDLEAGWKDEYQRYRKMIPVIREDVGYVMLHHLTSLPFATRQAYSDSIDCLKERIATWHFFMRTFVNDDAEVDDRHYQNRDEHIHQMQRHFIYAQNILDSTDISVLEALNANVTYPLDTPVMKSRSEYMGGISRLRPAKSGDLWCRFNPLKFPGIDRYPNGTHFMVHKLDWQRISLAAGGDVYWTSSQSPRKQSDSSASSLSLSQSGSSNTGSE